MKTIGYARASTLHPQLETQLASLEQHGCDKIYCETKSKCKEHQPELEKALSVLESKDTFVIFKLDRLSPSTKHLISLMTYFQEQEINFISLENEIDTSTPTGKFFFTIMNAFAEMETEMIRERVNFGLLAARNRGVVLGRPPVLKNIDHVVQQYCETDKSITRIAQENGISRPTVYRYLTLRKVPLRD